MLSRRTFVSWLGGLGAAIGLGVRTRVGHAARTTDATPREQPAMLDAVVVTRIAEVVLPGELGAAGLGRVSRAFTQWVAAYKPGAELVHPYGSTEVRSAGESPAARWRGQLNDLERMSRDRHQRGFLALSREQRRELLASALAGERTNRMPDPVEANHVALALVSWFFATPEATDLCYRARIGRNSCRPLANAPKLPLPLVNGGSGTGDGVS